MTTRNRTLLFLQFRKSFLPSSHLQAFNEDGDKLEKQSLITSGIESSQDKEFEIIEMGTLPPKWVDIKEEVQEEIDSIKNNITKLEKLYKNRLLPGFHDRTNEEKLIEQLTEYITSQFYKSQSKVKQLTIGEVVGSNEIIGKNVQIACALKLQECSNQFKQVQSNYLQKIKSRETMNTPDFNNELQEFELESSVKSKQTQAQISKSYNNEIIQQREREIDEIAKSIGQLAEIFKSLSTLVIDQGTLIDRIDYNVEQMNANITSAVSELHQAIGYQRSRGGKMCIFLLVGLIGFLVLLLIFKGFR